MRALFGLALAGAVVAVQAADARAQAQAVYPGVAPSYGGSPYYYAPPAPRRGYAFKDESILSINNSYLGYGNFVYNGPDPPAPGYVTRYGAAVVARGYPAYVPAPAPVPAPRGVRWFGRRRGYPY